MTGLIREPKLTHTTERTAAPSHRVGTDAGLARTGGPQGSQRTADYHPPAATTRGEPARPPRREAGGQSGWPVLGRQGHLSSTRSERRSCPNASKAGGAAGSKRRQRGAPATPASGPPDAHGASALPTRADVVSRHAQDGAPEGAAGHQWSAWHR